MNGQEPRAQADGQQDPDAGSHSQTQGQRLRTGPILILLGSPEIVHCQGKGYEVVSQDESDGKEQAA